MGSFGDREFADDAPEDVGGALEGVELNGAESGEGFGERGDPSATTVDKQSASAGGGVEADHAAVVRVALAADEATGLEGADDARHCRGPHLLGGGEFTEGDGTTEDDHGERGGAGSGESEGSVVGAEAAEEVDGEAVEAVGEGVDGGRGGGSCALGHGRAT